LPGVNVSFSPTSIEPGDDPQDRLFEQGLLVSHALVAVLTREGAGRPYVIWEAAAALGRGKLVVPMFVDIEAGDVPGPLTTKVQGVRLGDRADVVRAVARLQTDFSVADPGELSDDQWASLETAVLAAKAEPSSTGTTGEPALTPLPLLGVLSPASTGADWEADRRAAEQQETKRAVTVRASIRAPILTLPSYCASLLRRQPRLTIMCWSVMGSRRPTCSTLPSNTRTGAWQASLLRGPRLHCLVMQTIRMTRIRADVSSGSLAREPRYWKPSYRPLRR